MAASDKVREFAAVQRSILWKCALGAFATSLDLFTIHKVKRKLRGKL